MDAFHTVVCGDSGAGKTTFLREAHATFDGLSIWANDDDEDGLTGNDLEDAATVRSEREARESDATRLNWKCDTMEEALPAVRRVALEYARTTGYGAQVIADECQRFMAEELEQHHPAKKLLHEDRDEGIKFMLGTQDPSDMRPNYSALKQCPYFVFVGIPSPLHRGFADYFSLPKNEMPAQKYEYVVFGKERPFEWSPIYTGETNEVYG